jgi:hypothetical protein
MDPMLITFSFQRPGETERLYEARVPRAPLQKIALDRDVEALIKLVGEYAPEIPLTKEHALAALDGLAVKT